MKTLLLILLLCGICLAQEPEWKLIKEMSGEIPDHPGLTIEFYAAEITRGDGLVKLIIKAKFPWGAPKLKDATYPAGFDYSSISRMEMKSQFNCETLMFKPIKDSSHIYQFNGKRLKSKEKIFPLTDGHIFVKYFCERGETPSKAPSLKPLGNP